MKKKLSGILVFSAVSFCFSFSAVAAAPKLISLDNMIFVGEIKKMGDKAGSPAEIAFKNGKVSSSLFGNFKEAAYKTNATPRTTMFVAETPKQKEGKLKWMGAIKEKQMDGTLIWYKQDGVKPEVYTMKGELKR